MKKKASIIFLLLVCCFSNSFAQSIVSGVVYEEINGAKTPLPFTTVSVPKSTRGTITDFDGKFKFNALDNDTVIQISYIGYKTVTEKIDPVKGNTLIEIVMSTGGGQELEEVIIVARKNRESENLLILEQKKASIAVETIGVQTMSIQGVSDAAGAVTKLSGISKQTGSQSLNVRGLGDRYNTTTFNGLPLPSNNPELKNFDLSLFETDIISHIAIEKTFTSNLYGDFGGANIDVNAKSFVSSPFIKFNVKSSYNLALSGADIFYLPDVGNKNGFYSGNPPSVAPILNKNVYNFYNSWNPQQTNILPGLGIGLSGGRDFKFENNAILSSFFNVSYENKYAFAERIERMVNTMGTALTDTKGDEFAYETQSTAMLNLNLSKNSYQYTFNSLFLNTSDQSLTSLTGRLRDISANDDGMNRRAEFQRNMMWVNQLLGKNKISEKSTINWGVSYNYLTNTVPDRQQTTYEVYDATTNVGLLDPFSSGRNYRYYQDFDENEVAANVALVSKFGKALTEDDEYRGKWIIAYSGRYKIRDFHSLQFNHQIQRDINDNNIAVDVNNVDSYINEINYLDGKFNVRTIQVDGHDGFSYNGFTAINAGYGLIEYNLTQRLLLLAGLRFENVYQQINYLSSQNISGKEEQSDISEFKILPSLSMRYLLTEKQNLRFACSKTYTLPQLQEMPLIVFEGISDDTYGNPYIYTSEVYNTDLKWEFFPKGGELLSATLFGKYILDPINKFAVNTSFNEFTNANTGDWAYVYGLEIEAKKDIIDFGLKEALNKLYVSGNMSVMKTYQELDSEKVLSETNNFFYANFTNDREALQGAAPFIANMAFSYSRKWNEQNNQFNASLVYNYLSDRIFAVGHTSMGNQVDKAINTLDAVISFKFNKAVISFKAMNLLNPEFKRIQENTNGDELIKSYKRGSNFSLNISYKF